MSMHWYRGFEIYPLVYPRTASSPSSGRNYDNGFSAAVKICLYGPASTFSDTFKLHETTPFSSAGEARRASLKFAEGMIDKNGGENWMAA